jgi:hypothetical protein
MRSWLFKQRMPAVGQTATSTDVSPKSALPPKADILWRVRHVRFVPVTDFSCPSFSVTLQQSDDAGRQIKVRCFSHSQVDDKFEGGRSLNRYFGNRRAAQILIICRLTCVRQMPTMRVPYAASSPASAISRSEPGAREGDRSSAFCQTVNSSS